MHRILFASTIFIVTSIWLGVIGLISFVIDILIAESTTSPMLWYENYYWLIIGKFFLVFSMGFIPLFIFLKWFLRKSGYITVKKPWMFFRQPFLIFFILIGGAFLILNFFVKFIHQFETSEWVTQGVPKAWRVWDNEDTITTTIWQCDEISSPYPDFIIPDCGEVGVMSKNELFDKCTHEGTGWRIKRAFGSWGSWVCLHDQPDKMYFSLFINMFVFFVFGIFLTVLITFWRWARSFVKVNSIM